MKIYKREKERRNCCGLLIRRITFLNISHVYIRLLPFLSSTAHLNGIIYIYWKLMPAVVKLQVQSKIESL